MKFSVNSSELQKTLNKIGGLVPTKSTMPILENILFDLVNEVLTVTATDLDISITDSIRVKGLEDGRIAVPAKRLLDTIRALPDTSMIFDADTTTNKIRITTDNGEYALTGEAAKEFPAVPQLKATEEVSLESNTLKKIIHRTAFAVSTDELRPAMMGVLLQAKSGELRAVSTDGHRLVRLSQRMPKPLALKKDVVVPAKTLNLVSKSLDGGSIELSMNDAHVRFAFGQTLVVSRLIDETYPNYESVIPGENNKTMTVNRDQLVSSIRRVALYSSATTHQVRLGVSKSKLTISAQDIDFGGEAKESIPCEYNAEDLEIGFNSNYVVDILSHLDSEQVSFKFSSPTKAGIITPAEGKDNEDVIMLVMPVRLNV